MPYQSLFSIIMGTREVTAYMPQAPAFVTHGWSPVMLLAVLGLWPSLLGVDDHDCFGSDSDCSPLCPSGLVDSEWLTPTHCFNSDCPPGMIANSGTHLGVISPGQFTISISDLTL